MNWVLDQSTCAKMFTIGWRPEMTGIWHAGLLPYTGGNIAC